MRVPRRVVQQSFSEQQIREVLARAGEIQLHSDPGESEATQMEAIVAAAEEAGLSREAVLQAMRERLHVGTEGPAVGSRVFATSADGKFYVADVLELGERSVRVRFLKGGELDVPLGSTQPASFLPGQRIVCPWPDWGWWTCTVVSYDADHGTVRAHDGWGTTESFPISEVRMDPPRSRREHRPIPRLKFFLFSLAAGAALGGTLGGLITWLVLR